MKRLVVIIIIIIATQALNAQSNRKVLLLDLTAINAETNNSRFFSVEYILNNIKVPYDVGSDFNAIANYSVVIATSRIKDGVLTPAQILILNDYVDDGGVLITSSLRETDLFATFGIASSNSNNNLYEIEFDIDSDPRVFEYINDDLEKTISLGRASSGNTFYSKEYTISTGDVLGRFENNQPAFVHNSFGAGHTYVFGPDFRDVIYRNLLGLDLYANRTYSNGFEPTVDVFFMIVRNIIRKHIPYTIYPHTVPNDAKSVVLITHDIDSKTGYDTMHVFSQYEMDKGFSVQYNSTSKYCISSWNSYYPSVFNAMQNLVNQGHVISSHSIGHFPDFASFDLGQLGNNESNYAPVFTAGTTAGGTVLGELEFSEDLLEFTAGIDIRTFRAGHLAFPDSLILGLQMLGYEFNSTHSANDILTSYPYEQMEVKKFTTVKSTVLEIPMTISDVFHSDPISNSNYLQKVALWSTVTRKYADNHSPVNLLIHPNRNYKLEAQINYINNLPFGVIPYNFEDYGDFWRARQSLNYTTTFDNNILDVYFTNPLNGDISFLADVQPGIQVNFYDKNNQQISMLSRYWNATQTIFFQNALVGTLDDFAKSESISVFPNPTSSSVTFDLNSINGALFLLTLYDIQGRQISAVEYENKSTITISLKELPAGVYLYIIESERESFNGKIMKK
ncbi:MAG: hypothetical protein ACJA2N_001796 [Salibacteraceae bacterium]|jgi:hypothetical protein